MENKKPNIMLDWCKTKHLIEWAKLHFYYLPEAIADSTYEIWCHTLHEIMVELNRREFTVTLNTYDSEAESKAKSAFDFSNWVRGNAVAFGFDFPLNTRISLSYNEINRRFGDKTKRHDVNPLLKQHDNTTMGFQFYEWMANFYRTDMDECAMRRMAAQYFSWEYPQLKMICHNVTRVKPHVTGDTFLDDGLIFTLEFLS